MGISPERFAFLIPLEADPLAFEGLLRSSCSSRSLSISG